MKTIQLISLDGSQPEDIIYIFHAEYLRDSLHFQFKVKLSPTETSGKFNFSKTENRLKVAFQVVFGIRTKNRVNHFISIGIV